MGDEDLSVSNKATFGMFVLLDVSQISPWAGQGKIFILGLLASFPVTCFLRSYNLACRKGSYVPSEDATEKYVTMLK